MFKKLLYIIIPVLTFVIVSCDKDDHTDDSTLVTRNSTGTLTFDLPSEIVENDTVFEFTITVDPPQVVDIHIPVRALVESTATEGDDFTVTHLLVVPAFTTTASGNLTIIQDATIEEDETITIQIGNEQNANLNMDQSSKSITLKNFESSDLDIFADWGGTVSVAGSDYDLCESVDIDMYLLNSDGENMFGYDGATAACPEHLILSGLNDGVYGLYANLWASVVPNDSVDMVSYPITANFVQGGVLEETASQSPGSAINNADLDYYAGGSVNKLVAEITVSGDEYTWEMQ